MKLKRGLALVLIIFLFSINGCKDDAGDDAGDDTDFTCSGKTTCGEMVSCAEARFYLTTCGVDSLDGDNDGTPCESLCE